MTSALASLRSGGVLNQEAYHECMEAIGREFGSLVLLRAFNLTLFAKVVSFAARTGLRSEDGIHLATALRDASGLPRQTLVFISAGHALTAEAQSAGLTVLSPAPGGALTALHALRS